MMHIYICMIYDIYECVCVYNEKDTYVIRTCPRVWRMRRERA